MIRFENAETRDILMEKSKSLHLPVVGHLVSIDNVMWTVGDVLWDFEGEELDIVILLDPMEFS